MHPSGDDLTFLAQLADEKALEVIADRIFPFDRIAGAFAYLEQGSAKGKVVVQMMRQANEHSKNRGRGPRCGTGEPG